MTSPVRSWPVSGALAAVTAVALLLRLLPLASSGGLVGNLENDGGVMFAATLHLLAGQWPYSDFVYLHPPGSLILFAPAGLLASVLGEQEALALVRLSVVFAGGANTLLIGLLLRRFGAAAILVGSGLYAVWPVVTATERLIMLEPILNLCLLGALIAVSERSRIVASWSAGILLAFALSVKFWAVVDVVIIGAIILARFGWRGVWRYAAAGATTVGLLILPFFLHAPRQMWDQTVLAQLSRPATETSMAARVNMLSAFRSSPGLDETVPWVGWALLWGLLAALALLPLVDVLRRRMRPRNWPDPAWWAVIAVVHAVVMTVAAVFYDHYAAWLVAPLALTTGAAVSRLRRRRHARAAVAALSATCLALVAILQLAPAGTAVDRDSLRTWAAQHECVWGGAPVVIAANAVERNLATGCEWDPDLFGVGLTLLPPGSGSDSETANEVLGTRIRGQLEHADGVMVPVDPGLRPFTPFTANWFTDHFVEVGRVGHISLWERVEG